MGMKSNAQPRLQLQDLKDQNSTRMYQEAPSHTPCSNKMTDGGYQTLRKTSTLDSNYV
jgi:hypothetical protein